MATFLSACALTLALLCATASAVDVESINQGGTPKGRVLERWLEDNMQDWADENGGSTVRRFDKSVVEPRLMSTTPSRPGIVAQKAVIDEDKRKTRSNHSPSIAEVAEGEFVATWYGGTWERMGDIAIWVARYTNGKWRKAKKIGKPRLDKTWDDGQWYAPCWNPVLLYVPETSTTLLFYKRGLNGSRFVGIIRRSLDGGKTWGKEEKMKTEKKEIIGPGKNPPIILPNGNILSGATNFGRDTVHVELSKDNGFSWKKFPTIPFDDPMTQPSLLPITTELTRMVARVRGPGRVAGVDSTDKFRTFGDVYLTDVDTWKTGTGLHAIVLKDGRIVMVHNTPEGREELVISVSTDNGESYDQVMILESDDGDYPRENECIDPDNRDEKEPNEFTYPTIIQSRFDDRLHIVYTYSYFGSGTRCMGRENIKHVILDLEALDN